MLQVRNKSAEVRGLLPLEFHGHMFFKLEFTNWEKRAGTKTDDHFELVVKKSQIDMKWPSMTDFEPFPRAQEQLASVAFIMIDVFRAKKTNENSSWSGRNQRSVFDS